MKKQNEEILAKTYLNLPYYLKKYGVGLPDPYLHPKTKQVLQAADLAPIFPRELIRQETTLEKTVPIPDEVYELYKTYRPSPLLRLRRLEKRLGTPAHIFAKYEGVSPVGSHKFNTALPQAYYNKKEGITTLTTETGAGQWGSALSLATKLFGMKCVVFMVQSSYDQKPYRKTIIHLYGGVVHASPSTKTVCGKQFLKDYPHTNGSLGMAISEAIEVAVSGRNTRYALGSALNHVMLHQTIIGQEAKKQLEQVSEYPDVIIGCCGGGSNFAGVAFPFLADKIMGNTKKLRCIAVEPTACPSLTKGKYRYDYGDTAGMTPLMKMYTVGSGYVPSPIHAGGLRYHGVSPLVSFLYNKKLIEAAAYDQKEVFAAAQLFIETEGIIPAPESAHAIKHMIVEALQAKKEGKKKTILFNLSGHGLLDLGAYETFLSGKMK
ncbi:MAG: TrpB-like pyridoxal phosphate-dependent enzyme [Microgenomates group bacterium]